MKKAATSRALHKKWHLAGSTLVSQRVLADLGDRGFERDTRLAYLSSADRNAWSSAHEGSMRSNQPEYRAERHVAFQEELTIVGEFHRTGVPSSLVQTQAALPTPILVSVSTMSLHSSSRLASRPWKRSRPQLGNRRSSLDWLNGSARSLGENRSTSCFWTTIPSMISTTPGKSGLSSSQGATSIALAWISC